MREKLLLIKYLQIHLILILMIIKHSRNTNPKQKWPIPNSWKAKKKRRILRNFDFYHFWWTWSIINIFASRRRGANTISINCVLVGLSIFSPASYRAFGIFFPKKMPLTLLKFCKNLYYKYLNSTKLEFRIFKFRQYKSGNL